MNKLENLYEKCELLLKELEKVEEMIALESITDDMTNSEFEHLGLGQSIAKIKEKYTSEAYKIDKNVLDSKDCVSEHEWCTYMAYAERKKALNLYKCELECAQLNSKKIAQILLFR